MNSICNLFLAQAEEIYVVPTGDHDTNHIISSLICDFLRTLAVLVITFTHSFVIHIVGKWMCVCIVSVLFRSSVIISTYCARARVCVCVSVISFSFKSCHRPDTPLSGEAFICWFQMCLSSSPIIQTEIGIVTLWGLIQDKIEKWREVYTATYSHAPLAWSQTHSCSHTQIQNHMDEQLQYLSDNKSLQGNTASLVPAVESV